jgi:hypothetical protein
MSYVGSNIESGSALRCPYGDILHEHGHRGFVERFDETPSGGYGTKVP